MEIKHELDHGVIVPLYFVNKHAKDFRPASNCFWHD